MKALKGHLPGTVSISRPHGDDGRYVEIRLRDETSGITFVEAKMDMLSFTEALFGLVEQECQLELRGLANIGKVREREKVKLEYPKELGYNKDDIAAWLVDHYPREGWKLDTYLGSQGSTVYEGDKRFANVSYYRYVDPT